MLQRKARLPGPQIDGTPPHMKGIDMSKEPYCAKLHASDPVKMENVVVGANGSLQNVVIYISEGLTGNEANAVSSESPTWDQKGCQYIPHVMALDVNQHFKVVNSDQTSHNIHPMPKPGGPNHDGTSRSRRELHPLTFRGQARKSQFT